jgi:hypothetical protein
MEVLSSLLHVSMGRRLYMPCCTVQASLLFSKQLSDFLLKDNSFVRSEYDWCVATKVIDGKQATIARDDLKLSHAFRRNLEP